MNAWTLVFLLSVVVVVVAELLLAWRQIRHVEAHKTVVPEAFVGSIGLEDHGKAAAYTVAKERFGMLRGVIESVLLLGWTLGGGLQLLDHAWRAVISAPVYRGVAFLLSLALISGLLGLPATLYATFVIEQRFGFNKTTPALFVADALKSALLLLLLGAPLLLAILYLMAGMGPRWWLWVWGLWAGFSLLLAWLYPRVIAPLFNSFTPLPDGPLRQRIAALLEQAGFSAGGVFVMDASKRSGHGNAYFTGLGRTKRVVFFDTLVAGLQEEETVAVLAHELGHFRLGHMRKRLVLSFGGALAGFAVLGWLIEKPWFYAGLGVSEPSTYAALALFVLTGPVFLFFLQPLFAHLSRRHEFAADGFAAEHANADALRCALVTIFKDNAKTLTPDPWHSLVYDSHPSAPERIGQLSARAVEAGHRGGSSHLEQDQLDK